MKINKLFVSVLFGFLLYGCGGQSSNAQTNGYQVISPPSTLNVPSYYTKYINASGIPIVANSIVSDTALFKMKYIVDIMVWKDAATQQQLLANLKRILIIPKADGMTSLPEYVNLDQTNPLPNGETWNQRAQGVGWTAALPYMSCSEANLLESGYPLDRYSDQSICIHEFAHTVWEAGVVFRDSNAQSRLDALYAADASSGFLGNSYAGSIAREYWAEGVQAWFNAASCTNKADTPVCTNTALYQSEYGLWNEIGHWFASPYQLQSPIYP